MLQTALRVPLLMWIEDPQCQIPLWGWGHQPHTPNTQSGGCGCLSLTAQNLSGVGGLNSSHVAASLA